MVDNTPRDDIKAAVEACEQKAYVAIQEVFTEQESRYWMPPPMFGRDIVYVETDGDTLSKGFYRIHSPNELRKCGFWLNAVLNAVLYFKREWRVFWEWIKPKGANDNGKRNPFTLNR